MTKTRIRPQATSRKLDHGRLQNMTGKQPFEAIVSRGKHRTAGLPGRPWPRGYRRRLVADLPVYSDGAAAKRTLLTPEAA